MLNDTIAMLKKINLTGIVIVICTMAFSMAQIFLFNTKMDSAVCMWLLAAAIAFFSLKNTETTQRLYDKIFPWFILAAAFVSAWYSKDIGYDWSLFLLFCAIISYTSNLKLTAKIAVSGLIFLVVIPRIDTLHLTLSAPLSQICAFLTSNFLNLIGVASTYDQAIIKIGESQIAVTAACSGIDLWEAMLLLGWGIVYFEHKNLWVRLGHYFMLLPLIVFFNTLRLIVVILLSFKIGDAAFNEPLHSIFGYCVVILTSATLFSLGKLFKGKEEQPEEQPEKEQQAQ